MRRASSAVLAALVCCAPSLPPDDGFRARFALGCHTDEDCRALRDAAVERKAGCAEYGEAWCREIRRDADYAEELLIAFRVNGATRPRAPSPAVSPAAPSAAGDRSRIDDPPSPPSPRNPDCASTREARAVARLRVEEKRAWVAHHCGGGPVVARPARAEDEIQQDAAGDLVVIPSPAPIVIDRPAVCPPDAPPEMIEFAKQYIHAATPEEAADHACEGADHETEHPTPQFRPGGPATFTPRAMPTSQPQAPRPRTGGATGSGSCRCRDGVLGCCGRGCCSHHGGIAR